MERNSKQLKRKKWLKFRHVYAFFLLALTVYLAWHVLNLLVFAPVRMREDAALALGDRMENIQDLEQSWLDLTEEFGATLDEVDYVSIHWNAGPVVYVSVRIEPDISRRYARRAARRVIEHFIEVSDEVALQYDIQVVISRGDIAQQRIENNAAVEQHVHEYNHSLVEEILAWAEDNPSESNVNRADTNINSVFTNSIIETVGDEGLEEMRARLAAIEVEVLDEDEDPMQSLAITRRIPYSNISRFPNWGTWCNERSRIRWN